MLSDFEPPSDPEAIPAWLLAQEEEIAALTVLRLTAIIDDSLTAFTATLTAAGDPSVFDSIPVEWSRFVNTELSDRLGGMYLSGGVSAWIQAPGTEALSEATATAWTEVVNSQAVSYAQTATNRLTGPVSDSIWNDLKLKVSKAIETGASTERLTAEIATMSEFATYRAETIARTEVNGAYNAGTYESNQTLGDVGPVEKYWIATGDDRTRETHREADGQVRAFADPFSIGGSEMLYPHDPAGPAKEVVNCRCVLGYLYPGMARPDGTIVPESPAEQVRQEAVRAPVTTPDVPAIPIRQFGRGPAATQTLSDVSRFPDAKRGRVLERTSNLKKVSDDIDRLHGLPSTTKPIEINLVGKPSGGKGGHFDPTYRGAIPKRTRDKTYQQYFDEVMEYNRRDPIHAIQITDTDLERQAMSFAHETGHAVDYDGFTFRTRKVWQGEITTLSKNYGKDWVNHLDEIVDEEARLVAELGIKAREAESIRKYTARSTPKYKQYFTSVEEVWARAYSQWVAEVSDNPVLKAGLAAQKETGYQFTDEEFAEIAPIVEQLLRTWGLMR